MTENEFIFSVQIFMPNSKCHSITLAHTYTYSLPYGFWISLIYYILVHTDELWYGSLLWRCTISTTSRVHTHKSLSTHIQMAWISSFYERIVILYWNGPILHFTTAKYSLEMHENQEYKFWLSFHLINNNLEIFAIEWRCNSTGGHELGL